MKYLSATIIVVILVVSIFATVIQQDTEKGLAMASPAYQEDITTLNVGWWYNWTSSHYSDPKYVPMSWCKENPNLPPDYSGYILLFNEPELAEQCNITPQQGINSYMALQAEYPNAKWVVGNTTFWGTYQSWLNSFWDICNSMPDCVMPKYWGVHVYISGSSWVSFVRQELDKLHNKIGGTFWITEFADIGGDINTDKALVNLFKSTSYIDRYAYFTNRSLPTDPWIINGWNVDLFDSTGNPTAIGNWYMQKIYNNYLPIITK